MDLSRKSSRTNYIFDSYSNEKLNKNLSKNNIDEKKQTLLPSDNGRN